MQTHNAIILFGHGSRDPLWRAPMDAVAQRAMKMAPDIQVRCAFLELAQPDLANAVSELVATGATQVTIVPMFLGAGRHVREDLPLLIRSLERDHPGLSVDLRPTVGEHPQVLELLAAIAVAQTGPTR